MRRTGHSLSSRCNGLLYVEAADRDGLCADAGTEDSFVIGPLRICLMLDEVQLSPRNGLLACRYLT